jgi:hypothetical protein
LEKEQELKNIKKNMEAAARKEKEEAARKKREAAEKAILDQKRKEAEAARIAALGVDD